MGAADLVEGFGEASLPGDAREAGGAARLNILMVNSAATFVTRNDVTYKFAVVKNEAALARTRVGETLAGEAHETGPAVTEEEKKTKRYERTITLLVTELWQLIAQTCSLSAGPTHRNYPHE